MYFNQPLQYGNYCVVFEFLYEEKFPDLDKVCNKRLKCTIVQNSIIY